MDLVVVPVAAVLLDPVVMVMNGLLMHQVILDLLLLHKVMMVEIMDQTLDQVVVVDSLLLVLILLVIMVVLVVLDLIAA